MQIASETPKANNDFCRNINERHEAFSGAFAQWMQVKMNQLVGAPHEANVRAPARVTGSPPAVVLTIARKSLQSISILGSLQT
jgi:hypothetical protein